MKLIFKKDNDGEPQIDLVKGTTSQSFSYIEMLKGILEKELLEDPEFSEQISDDEKTRISELLDKIRTSIKEELIT